MLEHKECCYWNMNLVGLCLPVSYHFINFTRVALRQRPCFEGQINKNINYSTIKTKTLKPIHNNLLVLYYTERHKFYIHEIGRPHSAKPPVDLTTQRNRWSKTTTAIRAKPTHLPRPAKFSSYNIIFCFMRILPLFHLVISNSFLARRDVNSLIMEQSPVCFLALSTSSKFENHLRK